MRGGSVISTFLFEVLLITQVSTNIYRIGNDIKASGSGVDVAGATFLLRSVIGREGVLFAYSAYFRATQPVTFQIWRPTTGHPSQTRFELIGQTMGVMSTRIMTREDVYIESRLTEKCVHVRRGDRLGVYMSDSPGAVAYIFRSMDPTALGHRKSNESTPYGIGDVINFGTLAFPYDFSVAAYISSDLSMFSAREINDGLLDCPRGLRIPEYITVDPVTFPPISIPTGAVGMTGATGPVGEVGATGQTGEEGPPGAIGRRGQRGSTGSIGATGATGSGGTGATGPTGTRGRAGLPGPRGPEGDHGLQGPAGVPGRIIYINDGNYTDPVAVTTLLETHPMMTWGIIIWLIIVTIILLILLVAILVLARRMRKRKRSPTGADRNSLVSPTLTAGGATTGTHTDARRRKSKKDSFASYYNDKNSRHNSQTAPSSSSFDNEATASANGSNLTAPPGVGNHRRNSSKADSNLATNATWMKDMKGQTEALYSNEILHKQ